MAIGPVPADMGFPGGGERRRRMRLLSCAAPMGGSIDAVMEPWLALAGMGPVSVLWGWSGGGK